MSTRDRLEALQRRRAEAEQGGGADRVAAQHQKGKMTARERLDGPGILESLGQDYDIELAG